jgi:hypothetical protein
MFDVGGGSFNLTGFDDFSGLAAGSSRTLSVHFDPLTAGLFERVVTVNLFSHNASGYDGAIGQFKLSFRAEVAPVPVPAAVWLFGSALAALVYRRHRAVPVTVSCDR